MSLKIGCHFKWNVTQNGIALKMKWQSKFQCHSKCHNRMLLKMECYSKWNVTQNTMSLKAECHSKWNGTIRMSLKIGCHLKLDVI